MPPIRTMDRADFPPLLLEISDPPKSLYIQGRFPQEKDVVFLSVVGSRKHTQYGKEACRVLLEGIADLPVVIVSGLAIGMDTIVHNTALDVGLRTIAVPGSGLDSRVIYPRSNIALAHRILEADGCLISEYKPDFKATLWSFPRRNRIMAGLSHAVLIIEAERKSGSLITARLATEYNRDVLAVPGSIFSSQSQGPNFFIGLGATPISTPDDLRIALGFETGEIKQTNLSSCTEEEKNILEILNESQSIDALASATGILAHTLILTLTELEIKNLVVATTDGYRRCRQ